MIDDSRAQLRRGVIRAKRFLNNLVWLQLTGIITTNYDLLLEYALSTERFNYGEVGAQLTGRGKNPFFPWHSSNPKLTGILPLAKLHGSVSWSKGVRYTDGRCGLRGDATIVAPRPEKLAPAELVDQWKLAKDVLLGAKRLVVFGFAFNPYDQAVLELLSAAGGHIEKVHLIDIAPNLAAAQKLWPRAVISSAPPPRGPSFKVDCWY